MSVNITKGRNIPLNYETERELSAPDGRLPENAVQNMRALEERYEKENRLLQAISHGQTRRAEAIFASFVPADLQERSASPLRNLKNYAVICNTLFRKAAEAGSVHPLYIYQHSSRFAMQIEQCASVEAVSRLLPKMIHSYCLLVNNHSMKNYSLPVRKAVIRIDSDLTADLSLKAQAAFLEINPSYLSTLFKKETGVSLTEYVNRRRIEHGILLLNTTSLQIQAVAQRCGIPDVNYFSKLFKKTTGMTPMAYRKSITV